MATLSTCPQVVETVEFDSFESLDPSPYIADEQRITHHRFAPRTQRAGRLQRGIGSRDYHPPWCYEQHVDGMDSEAGNQTDLHQHDHRTDHDPAIDALGYQVNDEEREENDECPRSVPIGFASIEIPAVDDAFRESENEKADENSNDKADGKDKIAASATPESEAIVDREAYSAFGPRFLEYVL